VEAFTIVSYRIDAVLLEQLDGRTAIRVGDIEFTDANPIKLKWLTLCFVPR
jgi:hypothetical protein